jgi:hypothetical protein
MSILILVGGKFRAKTVKYTPCTLELEEQLEVKAKKSMVSTPLLGTGIENS